MNAIVSRRDIEISAPHVNKCVHHEKQRVSKQEKERKKIEEAYRRGWNVNNYKFTFIVVVSNNNRFAKKWENYEEYREILKKLMLLLQNCPTIEFLAKYAHSAHFTSWTFWE